MAKEKKNAKDKAKKTTAGGVCKLPAGTPSSAARDAYHGVDATTDPPVPNRAHTEI